MRGTFSLPDKSRLWQVSQRCCCTSAWPRCSRAGSPASAGGCGLRYLGDEIRKEAKVVVGQRLRHLVHRLEGAQLFAKHEELDQRVRRLLPAERGRVLGLGLALLAVTGETRRDALFDGFGSWRMLRSMQPPAPLLSYASAYSGHFRYCLRQTRSVCARKRKCRRIYARASGGMDCFASLAMTMRSTASPPPSACRR